MGCGLSPFSRAIHINVQNNAGIKTEDTTYWENYEGPTTDQPTKVYIQTCLTLDVSTLTRGICHGSSRPDPCETRTPWVTRSLAGRDGSGQQASNSRGSGRVGSGVVSNLTGRVGSGQEVLRYRGSDRVGSGGFKISRAGSGGVKTSKAYHGSGRER